MEILAGLRKAWQHATFLIFLLNPFRFFCLALTKSRKNVRRVPKGTSSYQAAWIIDSDSDENGEYESLDLNQDVPAICGAFGGSLAKNNFSSEVTSDSLATSRLADNDVCWSEELSDAVSDDYEDVELDDRASLWDTKMDAEEQAKQLSAYLEQRRKDEDEDLEFPDEVETPHEIPAKVRFARYRGLKFFRKSPWDPYENLPRDYGRIFQFENFASTRRRVTSQQNAGKVPAGSYVTLRILDVPIHASRVFDLGNGTLEGCPKKLLWVVGLLQYEHKKTTVHFSIQKRDDYDAPIKSKDEVVLQMGWRRFRCAPLYSEASRDGGNGVFKYERFLQAKRLTIGTTYAPVTFHGPVLMLQPGEHGSESPQLQATGNLLAAEATRKITKRIVLTGHPFKLHRKIAVVRWMFFSPEDVAWFKPVQLHTKFGRTGHIRESLGTHGYMKCIFDGPLKQNDTVCMPLYKRVFPKMFATLLPPSIPGEVEAETWTSLKCVDGGDSSGDVMELC
jgi:pre-rRNA-processing protein TSR1